ncbi:SDH family Clp fold serine proteinase [Erwinia aphidicola]|uniref:SDH family Clp fold serine proteinase n=1 Tax=Erwinia aphidicola TaxID=68334 RepID=UPI00209CD49E|nr:S49 family peptidase [Erwinia aphidicola]MCP2232862.1 ATP-dependent protease ClpP protease subunit [Erwinia aphidicola]
MGEMAVLAQKSPLDTVRSKYLKEFSEKTGRNVIAYYSGFLQKNAAAHHHLIGMSDDDKNGFMTAIHGLDATKGLDLLLHTPGGDIAALESIGNYLRSKFGNDIRAFVPMISMSAGTMLACCAKEIVMGKQSNIGPFDPQIGGVPAHGVIEESQKAYNDIIQNPASVGYWQFTLSKLNPTFIGECEKAIQWATTIVSDWLVTGMFMGEQDAATKADAVCRSLNNHTSTFAHARHIHSDKAKQIGLKITDMESDQDIQDLVLTIHHSYMHTFGGSSAAKIIENHEDGRMVWHVSPSDE